MWGSVIIGRYTRLELVLVIFVPVSLIKIKIIIKSHYINALKELSLIHLLLLTVFFIFGALLILAVIRLTVSAAAASVFILLLFQLLFGSSDIDILIVPGGILMDLVDLLVLPVMM